MAEKFDDTQLINLAKFYYEADTQEPYTISSLLDKDELTNDQRNVLLFYINGRKYGHRPMSMKTMKQAIFEKIGYRSTNSYSNSISADECKAIYDFVTKLEVSKAKER